LLYSALPFFRGAWRDIVLRRPGMDVPVAIGLVAASAASAWSTFRGDGAVYYDSVTMFIALLLLARYVELVARRRAGDAVEMVARARPASAERLTDWPGSRAVEAVGAAVLLPDDVVLVRPGATIPADGIVIEGGADVEEAVLTGESRPRSKAIGDAVLAGSVARDGALVIRVTAAGSATRLAAVERLVERASSQRPRVARVADRVASWFVALRPDGGDRAGLVADRTRSGAGGDVLVAGRVLSVRAVACHAGGAGGGDGRTGSPSRGGCACRCHGDAGEGHSRRA
jgi:Cu2+-exporting ATPase